jgi:hypothetical protein
LEISFPSSSNPGNAFRDESLDLCVLALLLWRLDQAFSEAETDAGLRLQHKNADIIPCAL